MSGNDDGGIDFKLYRYTPSLVAAVLFIVLFALTTAYHLWQTVRPRCWYFLVFVTGGVCKSISLWKSTKLTLERGTNKDQSR